MAEKDLLDRKILGADIVKSLKITKAAVNSDKNLVEKKLQLLARMKTRMTSIMTKGW